ncbi:unnamed protein product [Bemisia tabaci]|uniref:Uncharacterized protein n=1 Tax=Bemisia tabaci TaxID=7038 RepID=A0A9P0C8U4_BEMTA|nr:unnamed protein product [Bemisia tabaci]
MTHIHKTSFCVLYILIFISCSRGEAMNVNNTSLIEITTKDSCSADQDMELKPRAVPAGKVQMVPLNQLISRANMNQRRLGPSLNQLRARPNMNQTTVGLMQVQRTVVRQRSPYFRPNMNKYPKGAVYARYRVPPIYVTFKCPPKVGLLLCRGSCERRSKYTIGSCDNGYCTCLLLTPGFRGKGVFARRANCSMKEDRMKCNRFCRYQFGRTAYGLCRGTVCRCFTNPGISTKNQMTACEQARRRLAFLEASLRKILRKKPSTRTPAERRFLQEVRKRPEVLRRLATPRGRRSPRRMPYQRGTGSSGSPGSRKPQPTLQQTIPLSKIPNGKKYTESLGKSPARATKYVPGPSKSPYQSPRRNQRTGKSNSRKGGSNSKKGGSNSKKGGSNSRRVGSSPRKGGSSSKQAPKRAQSPLKNRRQSPGNGGFAGVPARKTRKEDDDDDDSDSGESGESGSSRNGGNGGARNGGGGARVGGGGGQGGGYGRGRGEDGEDGDEFGQGGGGGRGGGVGGGRGGGVGEGKGGGYGRGRGENGEDGDEFGQGGGGGRGGGVGGGKGGGYGRGRGEDGEDGDEFGQGGGGGLGGGLGGGGGSRSGGRNSLAGGGGSRGGGNGGYDTPGRNGYAPGGQRYGQGYGGGGNRVINEEDDLEENNRRGVNGGGRLAGDVPYGGTGSQRGGRGSVTPSVTPSRTPVSTPRSRGQVPPPLAKQTLDDPAIHVGGKFGDPAERSRLENLRDALEQERGIDPKTGKEVVVPPPASRQGGSRQDPPIPPSAREEVKVDPVTGQTYLPNRESKPLLPEEGACPIPPPPGVHDRPRDPDGPREGELRNPGGLRSDLRDDRNLVYDDDPPRDRDQGYRGNRGVYEDDYARPGRGNRNNPGGNYGDDEELLDEWNEDRVYDPAYDDDYEYEQRNRNPRGVRPPSYDDEEPRYAVGPQYQRENEYPQYQGQPGYANRQRELEEEEAYRREQELMQRTRPRY